jgi:hypothetical protein
VTGEGNDDEEVEVDYRRRSAQLSLLGEEDVEDVDPLDEQEIINFTYDITSYGVDFVVDGLVQRLDRGDIQVPPFQRDYVWNKTQADRFIESLLLGLPVPGIFLSREEETNKLLVIDGQQRLRTLHAFYEGTWMDDEEFRLDSVRTRFRDATYAALAPDDKRRLDDSILHATVIKQDQPSEDQSSVFFIFERLNSGGTQLEPQEIRAAIYQGEFNDLLARLNDEPAWRAIYGKKSPRLKDQELILRYLAMLERHDSYLRPMKEFLNAFMATKRHLSLEDAQQYAVSFTETIRLVRDILGRQAFKPRTSLSAAVFDAVMVGLTRRLSSGPVTEPEKVRDIYDRLLDDKRFVDATIRSTADQERVRLRIETAVDAFNALP